MRRGLERAGLGADLTRPEMEALGFFVCVEDLEDELIRALGTDAVERVVDAQGELDAYRTFQRQPQWRGRTGEEQLRRFFGTYRAARADASALVDASIWPAYPGRWMRSSLTSRRGPGCQARTPRGGPRYHPAADLPNRRQCGS